jgi:hypothetical protein
MAKTKEYEETDWIAIKGNTLKEGSYASMGMKEPANLSRLANPRCERIIMTRSPLLLYDGSPCVLIDSSVKALN